MKPSAAPFLVDCPLHLIETAHKLYPVRIRVLNIATEVAKWITIAYVPVVRRLQEPAADDRGRVRRCGVLQRVLYAAFREFESCSHIGMEVQFKGRTLTVFGRVLCYLCDRPEERAVLALKAGQCDFPCSTCMVPLAEAGAAVAVTAAKRVVIDSLAGQIEAAEHYRRARHRQRRVALEAVGSMTSFVPALAGMAGLSTEPLLLYEMIGFDILHVCSFCSSLPWRCGLPKSSPPSFRWEKCQRRWE